MAGGRRGDPSDGRADPERTRAAGQGDRSDSTREQGHASRRAVIAAMAGAAAGTAGCGSVLRSESTPQSLTPAPVPTDTPAPMPVAPGVTTAGVTDPTRLDRSHRETLSADDGFRIERTGLARYDGGFERARSRLTAARNGTGYRVTARQGSDRVGLVDEPVTAVAVWFDAGGTFRRVTTTDGAVRTAQLDGTDARAASEYVDIALPNGVRGLFAAFDRTDVSPVDEGARVTARRSGSLTSSPR